MTVSRQLTTMLNSLPEAAGKELLQYVEYLKYKYQPATDVKQEEEYDPWAEFINSSLKMPEDFLADK